VIRSAENLSRLLAFCPNISFIITVLDKISTLNKEKKNDSVSTKHPAQETDGMGQWLERAVSAEQRLLVRWLARRISINA
jgi:hypothetical protein